MFLSPIVAHVLSFKVGTEPRSVEKPLLINPSALYIESWRLIVLNGQIVP